MNEGPYGPSFMNMPYMMGNWDCFPTRRWQTVAHVSLDTGGGAGGNWWVVVIWTSVEVWDKVALSENPGVVWVTFGCFGSGWSVGVLDSFEDVILVEDGFVGCLEPDDLYDDDDDLRRGLCLGGGLWVVPMMLRMVVDTSLE